MSVAQTKTLFDQINSGNITSNEAKILELFIQKHQLGLGSHLPQLFDFLFLKESTIVARLSALEDKGLIYKTGELKSIKNNDSGNTYTYSIYMFEPSKYKQEENVEKVKRIKFDKWIKSGVERFDEFIPDYILDQLKSL